MSRSVPKEIREFRRQQRETLNKLARSEFREGLKPESWLLEGRFLQQAAEVLWSASDQDYREFISRSEQVQRTSPGGGSVETKDLKNLEVFRVYMLVAGLAIENMIKAIIVKNDPSLIERDKLDGKLDSHDLPGLFREAKVRMSPDEESYLKLLSGHVVWAGRYPVSKTWEDMVLWEGGKPGGTPRKPVLRDEPNHYHELFLQIRKRLSDQLLGATK